MKLKNRQDDASTLEWLRTYDWFAELRDDAPPDRPTTASPDRPMISGPRPETAAAPPASWPAAFAEVSAHADTPEITPPPSPPHRALGATRREPSLLRATIGDQLRRPVAWCEMGSCIGHHADTAALGEADIRARAISAGWRVDALGRLACPRCQQTSTDFRASHPVALWDRDNAITSAALTVAVMRYRRAASSPRWGAAEVIPVGQAAVISSHPHPGGYRKHAGQHHTRQPAAPLSKDTPHVPQGTAAQLPQASRATGKSWRERHNPPRKRPNGKPRGGEPGRSECTSWRIAS